MEKKEPKMPKPAELKKEALENWENEGGEIPSVPKTHKETLPGIAAKDYSSSSA